MRLARVVAPVLVVGAAAFAAGCDGSSGGDSGSETGVPPPLAGQPREAEAPPAVENATPEALAACGYPPGHAVPPADSPVAESLEACLRAIRGYPDPLHAPVDLVRTELAVRA